MEKLKLTIELVPYHSFNKNLHHVLSKSDWDKIRKYVYKQYHYQCAICGASNTRLSAHEEWDYKVTNYEEKRGTQKLVNIWSLCDNCHMIKHIAFASELARQGKLDMRKLIQHFLRVNNCEEKDFVNHYNESVDKWNSISEIKFRLSLNYIKHLPLELDSYPLKKRGG